jgi:uncharacterized protein YegP (UPF0339 family)
MSGKFVLKKSENDKYHFNLKAGNGEIILASELYESKNGATNGIESVKKNAGADERYERKTAARNQPYFVLKAGNGEVIGRSETYSSVAALENGIASVKKNAPEAEVEDLTVTA